MAFRDKLLDTPAEKVPHEFAQAVIDFVKPIEAVTTAYVGLTEITEDSGSPREQFAAAFVLADESENAIVDFAARFYASTPADVQAGGCNVLDAGGAAAWEKQAQRVFTR